MSVITKIVGNRLHVTTPYNAEFVSLVRNLRTRSYEGAGINSISISDGDDVKKLKEYVKRCYNEDININIPVKKYPRGVARIESLETLVTNFYGFDVNYNADFKGTFKNYRFDPAKKSWNCRVEGNSKEKILDFLEKWSFDLENPEYLDLAYKKIESMKEKRAEMVALSSKASIEGFEYNLPDDALTIYPFQEVGVKFLQEQKGRGLIADSMGLGKTIQALVYYYNTPEKRPILVICPAVVKLNWMRESKKWLGVGEDDVFCIKGRTGDIPSGKQVYIINYDIANARIVELMQMGFKGLVCDESHYLKNYKAKRTISVLALAKIVPSVICLTGTPILNRPKEIWTTIQLLGRESDFGNVMEFLKRYCDAYRDRFGLHADGATNSDELQVKLRSGIMIRRQKKDVLKELPSKNRIYMPLPINNRAEYDRVKKDFKNWYLDKKGKTITQGEKLVQIEFLRQAAMKGKMNYLLDYIEDVLENDSKIVVFAHHHGEKTPVIQEIRDYFVEKNVKVFEITGGMDTEEKQASADAFNKSDSGIAICSLVGSSVGINLQTSTTVLFAELLWTPAEHEQAEDRIHRIGQTGICNIHYCISENTVEDKIMKMIAGKQKIIDDSVDGIAYGENDEMDDMINEIIKSIMDDD